MLVAYRHIGLILLALAVMACGSTGQRTITPGVAEAGKLRVTIDDGWYRAPNAETPGKRPSTRVLTKNGIEHDRLYLVGGVDDGNTIFKEDHAGGAASFDASMSSDDVANLVAGSLEAALWGGSTSVAAKNATERGFTGIPGVQFDLEASGAGANDYRGLAGAFVVDERLYAVIFLAESPQYYERHRETAQQVIDSAILTIKTIRR